MFNSVILRDDGKYIVFLNLPVTPHNKLENRIYKREIYAL